MDRYRSLFIAALLLAAAAIPAAAIDIHSFDIHSGLLWLIDEPEDGESTGAPDPLLTPVGGGVEIPLGGRTAFNPLLLLYGLDYAFQGGDRPRPAQIEQREMYVISVIVSPGFTFTFPWTERLSWGAVLSPTMIFRIPAMTAPGEDAAHGEMLSYLVGGGRFLFPEAGLFLDIKISPRLSFRPALRTYLPVFHLWDGGELIDQGMVFFNAAFRFRMGTKTDD